MKLSEAFKQFRKRSGLSQTELGKKFGVTHGTVSYWENGKFDIPNKVIEHLWTELSNILAEPVK